MNPDAVEQPVEALPSWFVVTLVGALATIVGFGTIGLALAVLGVFSPLPTFVLGGAATAAIVRAVAPWRVAATPDRSAQVPAVLAVVLAIASAVFAGVHHAEHVLVDRDPGGYVVIARWLATHHDLRAYARVGAFRQAVGLYYFSPAVYDRYNGHLYFQFSHFFPTLLAEARWIGGDGLMFVLPALLGALALLAFYALATRFVRPWIALAAAAALGADLVQVHFSRDAYSELPTQVVLLGALWLLTRRQVATKGVAAFTGLLLGTTVMTRVDGPLYLAAIPFVLGAAVLARRRDDPAGREPLAAAGWLTAATVFATAIGFTDVTMRSPGYVKSLGNRVPLLYVVLAIACVAAVALAAWAPRLISWPARAANGRVADSAALVVVAGFVGLWFVRPYVQRTFVPFDKQKFYGVSGETARTFHERSLVWQSWYLGPIALAAAIIGLGLLVRAALRGRGGPNGIVVAAFLPVAAVYLWDPNITNDHIWVMRRYLPLVIPGFVLFAFVVVELLVQMNNSRWKRAARAGAVVVVLAALAWPAATDWPVRDETTQRNFVASVEKLCATFGPKAAVVVLEGGKLELVLPQTLRSFCNVPVAVRYSAALAFGISPADLAKVARLWRRDGRTLFLVADRPERIDRLFPGLEPVGSVLAINTRFLRKTILVRPHDLVTEQYRFVVAEAPITAG